jgi:hypothetical protein
MRSRLAGIVMGQDWMDELAVWKIEWDEEVRRGEDVSGERKRSREAIFVGGMIIS